MPLELWIAFVLASAALLAIPGPTVTLVVSYALARGRSTGWASVPGVALGDFTAMTASLAGAGAILAASATLFTVLKFVGAAYLIWLGIRLWRAKPDIGELEATAARGGQRAIFWHAWIVTALNPKGIVFFVAFVPQFIDPAQPVLMQFVILEATFVVMAAVNVALWVVAAGTLRQRFRKPQTLRLVNRIGGGFLIGAGLVTAAVRRV
ncbi:MAG: LysE family translocator [Minwuia sp.]|uniref:LysE family translocator n=1 Tax=Minwuia sp. TaxID=2493630 RepID=UPI003A860414